MRKLRSTLWAIGTAAVAVGCAGRGDPDPGAPDPGGGAPTAASHWYDEGMAKRGIGRPKVIYPVQRGVSPPPSELGGEPPAASPWAGFAGACAESSGDREPTVLQDQLADRWVFSRFATVAPTGGHQCFAVSQTPDPRGPYFLYDFLFAPGGGIVGEPGIGVWPDAYYLAFNEVHGGGQSAVAAAVDRNAMLLGLPAAMVRFDV